VPRDRILAAHTPDLHGVNFYNVWARYEHWYTFVRVAAKAELLAGLAQLVVDTLELGDIPVIRQRIGNILEFAQICRGMTLAAEELAEVSEGGLMVPDHNAVTAARSYALTHLPDVLHTIRDICGQGLILRFSEADLEVPAAFGQKLSWFLDTRTVSAWEKNLVMNLVWDVTSGAHATRMLLFEESNALNVPFLKERLYGTYDRSAFVDDCRHFIGLGNAPKRIYQKEIVQTWSREARD
jgi:4-hydroxyphenylacetate 3-monooxygenase